MFGFKNKKLNSSVKPELPEPKKTPPAPAVAYALVDQRGLNDLKADMQKAVNLLNHLVRVVQPTEASQPLIDEVKNFITSRISRY